MVTGTKAVPTLLVAAVALLIVAGLSAMFFPHPARRVTAAADLDSVGTRPVPSIRPDAVRSHAFWGLCVNCHTIAMAPAIAANAAPPPNHRGRGVCTNCHGVLNPSALGSPGALVGGAGGGFDAGNPGVVSRAGLPCPLGRRVLTPAGGATPAPGGSLACPGCGYAIAPRWRAPCSFVLCPKCGQRMTRAVQ